MTQIILLIGFEILYLIKKRNINIFNECLLHNSVYQNKLVVLYWGFIFILLFVRPLIERDSFAVRSIKEFSWYTSMIAVIYVPIGIKAIIIRKREHIIGLLPFLCVCGSIYILYLYNPSISQDHIWCSRRWVFLSISFVMICFVNSLGDLRSGLKKEYGYLLLMTVICYLLYQDSPFLTVSMYENLDNEYKKLAENLSDDEIYFASNTRLASTLKFVYNKSVYYIDIAHFINFGRTVDIMEEMNKYMQENKCQINYIGDVGDLGISNINYEEIYSQNMTTIDLPKSIAEFPQETCQLLIPANIYILSAKNS